MRSRRLLLQAAALLEKRGSGVAGRGRDVLTATIAVMRGRPCPQDGPVLITESRVVAGRPSGRSSPNESRLTR